MQNQCVHKYLLTSVFTIGCMMMSSVEARPVFAVSPIIKPQNFLRDGVVGTAIYQVFNA